MLFSDDPKDAIDRDYAGNSYYLELTLELSGPDEKIDGAEHASESGTSEREDSPYGIFLQGRRWILQPDKLRVTLSGEPPDVTADLAGVFLLFDTEDPTTPPRPVPVQGQLHAAAQHR
jgi:hypothetical protein